MNQAGNIKGAYTVVQRNTKSLKLPAAGYYKIERDGLDEMRMHGLVWVDRSSMGWGRGMPQHGMDETLISNCAEPAAGGLLIQHPVYAVPD